MLKTRMKISPLFFAVLTAFLILDRSGIASEVLLFSALHEAGHFLALLCSKTPPEAAEFTVFGVHLSLPGNLSTAEKCFVLAAGFAVNFVLSSVLFLIGSSLLGYINLFIGIFTAMPLPATDGGAVLKALLEEFIPQRAERILKTVSAIFSFFAAAVLLAGTVLTKNYYLLIAVVYICAAALK